MLSEVMQTPGIPSGDKSEDALIYTGEGILHDIVINTDGTNNIKVVIYDNTTASGTVIWSGTVLGTVITGFARINRRFTNGIYVDVTSSGTINYNVSYSYYKKRG